MNEHEKLLARFGEVYNQLVDETTNPNTLHNREKNHLLSTLLDIFEYVRGYNDENPVPELFDTKG